MTSEIEHMTFKLPASGTGFNWKVNQEDRTEACKGLYMGCSQGISEENWVNAKIESVESSRGPPKTRSTTTVTTNIQKSPLDKQFFMSKIKMSKRINQQRPSDLSAIGKSCLSHEQTSSAKVRSANQSAVSAKNYSSL